MLKQFKLNIHDNSKWKNPTPNLNFFSKKLIPHHSTGSFPIFPGNFFVPFLRNEIYFLFWKNWEYTTNPDKLELSVAISQLVPPGEKCSE